MTDSTEVTSTSPTTKTCSGCERELSTALFTKKSSNADGLESRCIECRAHARRLAQYDLTPQAYLRMGYLQDWRCAICRTPQNELERGLVVDHNHVTGEVRALLCHACNIGIGNFRDQAELMIRAAEYVGLWSDGVLR